MVKKNPFVFCLSDGRVLSKADNFMNFKKVLKEVPLESVVFHTNRGDFANWLTYLGKKDIADEVRKVKGTTGRVRARLLTVVNPSIAKKILKRVKKNSKKRVSKTTKKSKTVKKATKKKTKSTKKK